jgi:hypothetical protein
MQERETTSQYLGSESHFASMADDSILVNSFKAILAIAGI